MASATTIKDAPATTTTRKSATGAVRRLQGAALAEPGCLISGDTRRSQARSFIMELQRASTNWPSPFPVLQ